MGGEDVLSFLEEEFFFTCATLNLCYMAPDLVFFTTAENSWEIQKAVFRAGGCYSKCNPRHSVYTTLTIAMTCASINLHWWNKQMFFISKHQVKHQVFQMVIIPWCRRNSDLTKHACTGTHVPHASSPPEVYTHSLWKCLHRIRRWTTRPTGTPSRRWRRQRSPFFLCYWKVHSLFCQSHTKQAVRLWRGALWHISINLDTGKQTDILLGEYWQDVHLCLDITFIHEGNKTFHDNLVNFEKLVSFVDLAWLRRLFLVALNWKCHVQWCPFIFAAHDCRCSAAHPAVSERSHGSVFTALSLIALHSYFSLNLWFNAYNSCDGIFKCE